MNRIIRDVLILVAFCSAFYMLTLFVGSEEKFGGDRSNFSRDRVLADENFGNGDWEVAIQHYQQLLLDDPFNELALVQKARANLKLAEQTIKALKEKNPSEGENQKLSNQVASEIAELVSAAVVAQEPLLDSTRFRAQAIRHLIILNCLGGNKQAALEAVDLYASEPSSMLRSPITLDRRLWALRREPAFIQLHRRERNTSSYFHQSY